MSEIPAYIALALAFAALLVWLMRAPRHTLGSSRSPRSGVDRTLENVLPTHYRFFPQVRRALSDADRQYLLDVAPPEVARQALLERRMIARRFLLGLREDFSKLDRLARMVAALSPVISRKQEVERLMLSLRFRVLYSLVWMRLYTGRVPLPQIESLTGLVGRLALRMQQAMAEINALAVERIPGGLSV